MRTQTRGHCDDLMDGFHCSDVVAFLPRAVLSARTGNWCMLASTRSGTRRPDMAMGVIPCHSQSFRHCQAYPLQKTAYRRANGGSGAPGVHEDVAPKFVSAEVANWQVCLRVQKGLGPKENDESLLYWHQDGIKFHAFTDFGDIWVLAGAIAGSQRTQVGGAQHFPGFGGQRSFDF